MKRRNFITTSALTLGAIPVLPSTVFSTNSTVSLSDLGNGFMKLNKKTNLISVNSLSTNFLKYHSNLISLLENKGFTCNEYEVSQLSDKCFILPVRKSPLIGFKSNELALIVEKNGEYEHYILNEHVSIAFNQFIENFELNVNSQELDLDYLEFITPVKIKKVIEAKESLFVFENSSNKNITLKGSSKRQLVSIY